LADFENDELALDQMLLDPNNYRFKEEHAGRQVPSRRFAEASVQAKASERLRADGLTELKGSISANGFVPVERIVVRPWAPDEEAAHAATETAAEGNDVPAEVQQYVVVEGNRRVAALKWLKEDSESGIDVPAEVTGIFDRVPVVVINDEDEATYLAIMGIRHVGGIKQWGGYQSARLVYELRHDHGQSAQDVAERLGLSAVEINRRYRAYQAMQQMKGSDEYAEFVASELYPLFHEALVSPKLRDWLGWKDDSWSAENAETREQFYSLISPYRDSSGTDRDAKLESYSDVREIKNLLDNEAAMESLLDLEKPFSEALALAKSADATKNWLSKVKSALAALDSIGLRESKRLTEEETTKLQELVDVAEQLIEAAEAARTETAADPEPAEPTETGGEPQV
jgi:hypothetical protein